MHSLPPDHNVRSRFSSETNRNFSLICPAGSGKTHSLTGRIAAIAQRPDAVDVLPRLAMVTYTRKAAEEMQQRARALVAGSCSSTALQAFGLTYFGTIHSFAVELLRTYGHFIGVPSVFEVAEDMEALWREFLHSAEMEAVLARSANARVLRHVPLQAIFHLAHGWDFVRPAPATAGEFPALNFGRIYGTALPKRADTAANIARAQAAFRRFEAQVSSAEVGFIPLPRPTKGGADFLENVRLDTLELAQWIGAATGELAASIALAFRHYRVRLGVLGYDDQIQLAVELLRNPEAAAAIRARGFVVLLDEAQDTDPAQFEFLIEAVRPIDAAGPWTTNTHPPAAGRFCMVGDLQQSIYGARADLATYRRVHDYITQPGVGEALAYEVTFRCGTGVIAEVNRLFPAVLSGQHGQVPFIPLQAKPAAAAGQVLRVEVSAQNEIESESAAETAEAEYLARWLHDAGLEKLRARSWGQVAILCPRIRWFAPIRAALQRYGLESQLLSTRKINADSPAYAWFTALAHALVFPRDTYEIVGVLREVFGVKDADLAAYAQGDGHRLRLDIAPLGDGTVPAALRRLRALQSECDGLPLRSQAQVLAGLLRPRLSTLPLTETSVLNDLDRILLLSAQAESDGKSLHEFVDSLIRSWESVPDEPEDAGRISIITQIKSKGLEWDAVIVPFLFRLQREPSAQYPRAIGARNTAPVIAFSSAEVSAEHRQDQALADMQELERILYVTCTRARHTLALVDDRALFAAQEIPNTCSAAALRVASDNSSVWLSLATEPSADDALAVDPLHSPANATDDEPFDLGTAQAAAGRFPRLLHPSEMNDTEASIEEPEVRGPERAQRANTSLDYGVWWHATMKGIEWSRCAGWQTDFDTALQGCPDPVRARNEFAIFQRSTLAQILREDGVIVLTEAPSFLAQPEAQVAIDGVLDLAIHRPAANRWLIVDWKTTARRDAQAFAPQVSTYQQIVHASTGIPADGGVYFTATGEMAAIVAADAA